MPRAEERRLPPAPARPLLGAGEDWDPAREGSLALEERRRVKRPRRFKVLLHNDDFTTMDFVVGILIRYFHKSAPEAARIMLAVHQEGVGTAGVYTYEVAETKVAMVTAEAREQGMPLQCTVEPE